MSSIFVKEYSFEFNLFYSFRPRLRLRISYFVILSPRFYICPKKVLRINRIRISLLKRDRHFVSEKVIISFDRLNFTFKKSNEDLMNLNMTSACNAHKITVDYPLVYCFYVQISLFSQLNQLVLQ